MATTTLVRGARSTRSTIALKLLMAVSGLVFIGFVLLHMYGNLKAFAGHDAYNEYAHHLRTIGEPMLPDGGPAVDPARRAARLRWSPTCTPPSRCGAGPARRRTQQYQVKTQPRLVVLRAAGCAGAAWRSCSSSSGTC